ncbi:uncharacterized protein LOC127096454 [Lathyrus oleraceus]|uniref:uncharacterized protein LOC127096454 n=1 Tax=Pisum sativum TaxID=3888 RepID=UPI0021CF6582|nr:uncharacterized protein LOC127096454 [Pisum sativum]
MNIESGYIVHSDMFPKVNVSNDVKSDVVDDDIKLHEVKDDVKLIVVEIDVGQHFINEQTFTVREHMFEWVCMKVRKLGFDVVIRMSGNSSKRRQAFATIRCDRSDTYVPPIQKLKRDDIESRKCGCPFKFCGYCKVNDTWKFNVIYGIHNHVLQTELVGHPIICRLKPGEKEIVSDMSLIRVASKNILADLKRKRPENVSNIKQLLDDNQYVSRYKVFRKKSLLPLLEVIGVTSNENTLLVGFSFLESEEDVNITWALEICKTLLKEQENMLNIIIIDQDTALMNSVEKVFPTSYALIG